MGPQLAEIVQNINDTLIGIKNTIGEPTMIECITLSASVLSLVILIVYTIYTKKIAKATQEALELEMRPTISCMLKSGKNHYPEQDIQQNPDLKYDTRCRVTNYSKYNAAVFVNLNLKIDGQVEKISDEYDGEKSWPITSFLMIEGHFPNPKSIQGFKEKINNAENITIELELSYKSDSGKLYKNPTQHWHFNKEDEVWVNDIGLAV